MLPKKQSKPILIRSVHTWVFRQRFIRALKLMFLPTHFSQNGGPNLESYLCTKQSRNSLVLFHANGYIPPNAHVYHRNTHPPYVPQLDNLTASSIQARVFKGFRSFANRGVLAEGIREKAKY